MVIYQYQLNIIPRKSIIEKYGNIPTELFIDDDSWEKYWENIIDIENLSEPDFEDAKTIKWWDNIKLDVRKTSEQIDKLVSRANWEKDSLDSIIWKGNSNNEDIKI